MAHAAASAAACGGVLRVQRRRRGLLLGRRRGVRVGGARQPRRARRTQRQRAALGRLVGVRRRCRCRHRGWALVRLWRAVTKLIGRGLLLMGGVRQSLLVLLQWARACRLCGDHAVALLLLRASVWELLLLHGGRRF
jgi:hypothetical protein